MHELKGVQADHVRGADPQGFLVGGAGEVGHTFQVHLQDHVPHIVADAAVAFLAFEKLLNAPSHAVLICSSINTNHSIWRGCFIVGTMTA